MDTVRFYFQTFFEYFMLLFALNMVQTYIFPKPIMSPDAKHVDVEEVDVDNRFINGQEFEFCDHMLQYIST